MPDAAVPFGEVWASLADLAGSDCVEAVCEARAALSGEDPQEVRSRAFQPVEFYPAAFHQRQLALLRRVGEPFCRPAPRTAAGATTAAFEAASHREPAPLTGFGFFRVGEDGRLYFITKSEHYHAPVGHTFPGYALLAVARELGIPQATHNNTRGHLTRLLEETLVRVAQALPPGQEDPSTAPTGLNRVLNLETGSLAVEAGIKLMLARFYQVQEDSPPPPYRGRVPVFLVLGNDEGGLQGNYHGTTVLAQLLRGMWPGFSRRLAEHGLFQVAAVRPNVIADLTAAFASWERPPYKIAGFLHEFVMMNYGARRLTPEFIRHAYSLCARHDVPTLADEIQSCLWVPGLFHFVEYGVRPTMVALGKGFPGGEYPASRLLFDQRFDLLPQFGALVTNGQEEIASLAYLITLRWALANAEVVRRIGERYEAQMRSLAARYPGLVAGIAGQRHLLGVEFHDLAVARAFTAALNRAGLDISVQTYKSSCPPVALTKLPITVCDRVVDFVVERMEQALSNLRPAP
ncbi:MAG: aminotransferase class III-fold pyridoxal phosphate-dependent enzyme [Armatimonadota bacterium]|nr:aminotransferase class III-fold pyridoxal phosphate-dependent enzyme [Armatimonadota bacterium]